MTGKIALFAVTAIFSALTLNAAELYVSKDTGKNSNAGTKDAPFKNLQKALDVAAAGDKIHVAAGNYFGLMDKGYLEMKKPVEIYGGYTADFSSRSPLKNRTLVMPPASSNGTANSKGLLNIELSGEKNANLVIDGIIFDKGDSNAYHATNGKPNGVDTGMLQHPPAAGANGVIGSKNPILRGSVGGGKMLIQNCVFNNGAFYGIQMGFGKGDVKLLNNVFTSNAVAAVEISGLHNAPNGIQLEFAYNTVLYSWARTKDNTDMGYGFRNMTMVDTNIHHNLIGLSSFSGIDRTRIDTRTPDVTFPEMAAFFAAHGPLAGIGIASFGPIDVRCRMRRERSQALDGEREYGLLARARLSAHRRRRDAFNRLAPGAQVTLGHPGGGNRGGTDPAA